MSLRGLAHRLLNAAGIEVRLVRNLRAARLAEKRDRELDAWRILSGHGFRSVLDIGANEGQFASIARRLWPQAQVHSFEPLPEVHAKLVTRFQGDPLVHAHPIALSAESGVTTMHQSAFSPSSSLLPMAEIHRQEWPQSAEHREVEVRLERLDDWAAGQGGLERPLLVKIDVQGYELSVLDGGPEVLRGADVVVLEVSFHELYEGQPLFAQIHARMAELGFEYRGNIEQFTSKDGKRVLFADALFLRASRKSVV